MLENQILLFELGFVKINVETYTSCSTPSSSVSNRTLYCRLIDLYSDANNVYEDKYWYNTFI